jgi:hypothetical protein
MTCYFRHLNEIFDAAGIEVTKDNKKEIDRTIHELVGIEYKDCPSTWKAVKEHIRSDEDTRLAFIEALAKAAG